MAKIVAALSVLGLVAATPDLSVWDGLSLFKLKVSASTRVQHEALHEFENFHDVWGHGTDSINVVLAKDAAANFPQFESEVLITDLRAHFEAFFATSPVCNAGAAACVGGNSSAARRNDSTIDDPYYGTYQRFDTILAKMESIEAESGGLVELFSYGTSYEGRSLNGFKITGSKGFGNGKKVAVYNCGIHAREWIPPAFCVYLVQNMAAEYGVDATITSLLDEFEIHTIPIANPDGYEYSHTDNNQWRKSRKPNSPPGTWPDDTGTDLNRNFEYMWGTGGSSDSPRSDSYMGAAAFDNPESKALADYWDSLTNAVVQMDIHAYGGMWMYPMGHKSQYDCLGNGNKRGCGVESDADYNAHEMCGMASKAAVEAVNGYKFDVGPIPWVIYQASGSTCDHAYATSGIRWAYAIEVRGPTFQPTTPNIKLSNLELYEGVKAQLACIEATLMLEAQGIQLPNL